MRNLGVLFVLVAAIVGGVTLGRWQRGALTPTGWVGVAIFGAVLLLLAGVAKVPLVAGLGLLAVVAGLTGAFARRVPT